MDGKSFDVKQDQLRRLQEAFPESITEGKVDWEKLRLSLGEELILQNERYVLNWAGKSDAFRAIQTPTTATLKPQKDQSINFDTTENIFIEGENLEVLKVLQKSYYGKIKMIYIDPPYNTGNDSFIYPDKFSESKDEYLKRIGDKDEAGYLTKEGFFRKNSKENGQYHSNWLSMMYPRLFLARNLLRDDGVIFVSIDDNEVHNLRLMMNEIFGEENFVAQLVWKSRQFPDSRSITRVSTDHEYIFAYTKQSSLGFKGIPRDEAKFSNPDSDKRGSWMSRSILGLASKKDRPNLHYEIIDPITSNRFSPPGDTGWRYSRERMETLIKEGKIIFPQKPDGRPREKKFRSDLLNENVSFPTIIDDIFTAHGTAEIRELFSGEYFDFPKPTKLIKTLLTQAMEDDDIVLDFFAGSGTTAQAALELNKEKEKGGNCKFILAQLPEKTDEDTEAYKAGYKTIADICKERIRRVSKKLNKDIEKKSGLFEKEKLDLGFKVYTLEPSNFKIWRTDVIDNEEDLKHQMNAFVDPTHKSSEAEDMAWEIMLKSGYELTTNLEKIDVADVPLFSIAESDLILALELISQEAINNIIARKPKRVIALDRLFAGNDQLKTNTALQMKDAGIEFRTI
ncbi:MAG: site-specific DNA-methyltransferase [Bacteroidota bacterium]